MSACALQRTEATVKAPDGGTFKVTKGAAHAVLSLINTDNKDVVAASVNQKVWPGYILLDLDSSVITNLICTAQLTT